MIKYIEIYVLILITILFLKMHAHHEAFRNIEKLKYVIKINLI